MQHGEEELVNSVKGLLKAITEDIRNHKGVEGLSPEESHELDMFAVFCNRLHDAKLQIFRIADLRSLERNLTDIAQQVVQAINKRIMLPDSSKISLFDNIGAIYKDYSSFLTTSSLLDDNALFVVHEQTRKLLERSQADEYAIGQIHQKVDRIHGEAQELKTKIQSVANDLGIARYHTLYEEEAKRFKQSAGNWLFWILVLIIATVGVATFTLGYRLEVEEISPVAYLSSKIVIFVALIYALTMFIKNYKVAKHNEVLNMNKHKALSTFQVFMTTAAEDKELKNEILREITRTIFSSNSTGFVSNDADDSPNHIIEVISKHLGKN